MHNVGFNNLAHTVNKLFGENHQGVTKEIFRKSLADMGISAPREDVDGLYRKYDSKHTHKIPLFEMKKLIETKDYEGTWNAKREQEDAALRSMKNNAPTGILMDELAPKQGKFGRRASTVEKVESVQDALYGLAAQQSSRKSTSRSGRPTSRSSRSSRSSRRSGRNDNSTCYPALAEATVSRGRGYVPPRIQQTSLLPQSGRFTLIDTWKEATPEIGINGTNNCLVVAPNKLTFAQVKELQRDAQAYKKSHTFGSKASTMGMHSSKSFIFGTIADNRLELDSSRLPGGLQQRTMTLKEPGILHFNDCVSKKDGQCKVVEDLIYARAYARAGLAAERPTTK
jgi:hypothetical protein